MTYYVSSGTLNSTNSTQLLSNVSVRPWFCPPHPLLCSCYTQNSWKVLSLVAVHHEVMMIVIVGGPVLRPLLLHLLQTLPAAASFIRMAWTSDIWAKVARTHFHSFPGCLCWSISHGTMQQFWITTGLDVSPCSKDEIDSMFKVKIRLRANYSWAVYMISLVWRINE